MLLPSRGHNIDAASPQRFNIPAAPARPAQVAFKRPAPCALHEAGRR